MEQEEEVKFVWGFRRPRPICVLRRATRDVPCGFEAGRRVETTPGVVRR
jgi:hypothetical protein